MPSKSLADVALTSDYDEAQGTDLLFIERSGAGGAISTAEFLLQSPTDPDATLRTTFISIESTVTTNTPRTGTPWLGYEVRKDINSAIQVVNARDVAYSERAVRVLTSGVWSDWIFSGKQIQTLDVSSGDDLEFTAIPIYAKSIDFHLDGVSVDADANLIRLYARRNTSGVLTSGYEGASTRTTASAVDMDVFTDGMQIQNLFANEVVSGIIRWRRVIGTNEWKYSHDLYSVTGTNVQYTGNGKVNLGAAGEELEGVRFSTSGAGDFDGSGTVRAIIET